MPRKRSAAKRRKPSSRQSGSGRRTGLHRLERSLFALVLMLLVATVAVTRLTGSRSLAARLEEAWQNRPRPVAAAEGRRVGLIAGHKGYDSGAVCPNGVVEQEVVQRIAELAAERLRRAGAAVELLDEYDARLNGYRADVLVSIHADSCIERSGFKAARWADSPRPAPGDRLLACLVQAYGEATALAFDHHSITEDMTAYHAFRRVAAETPAAIVEVGFLGGDQVLLTQQPERPARGIANGILCFLEGPTE
ncbi:MAG: N-acetylmuramoyl-L-alanine amidase [Caldilineales bacterium]|nr:N-acetylmuramoyl-L-alanine amidase [Caldilineales bacterium]